MRSSTAQGGALPKVNPYCPVPGCRTATPHIQDPLVAKLASYVNYPQVYLHWVKETLIELRASMKDDFKNGRRISWLSRIRVVEELYFRTLYLLFVATPYEVPHVLSGDPPNSISNIYERVNAEILLGTGELTKPDPGLRNQSALEWLHIGAHMSYPMLMALKLDKRRIGLNGFLKAQLDIYLRRIQKIGQMIVVEGLSLEKVKVKVIDMHRPNNRRKRKPRP